MHTQRRVWVRTTLFVLFVTLFIYSPSTVEGKRKFIRKALAPRAFDRDVAATERFRSARALDQVGTRLHAMIQKQQQVKEVQKKVELKEKDVMRLREELTSKIKQKASVGEGEGGHWWLDDLPWWMPPPPEWGPLPPQMYNSYYHSPEAPIFSTPNYGALYQKNNDMTVPPMGSKADSERFIAKSYENSEYHRGQYKPTAVDDTWHPQPTHPIGNTPGEGESKEVSPTWPAFIEIERSGEGEEERERDEYISPSLSLSHSHSLSPSPRYHIATIVDDEEQTSSLSLNEPEYDLAFVEVDTSADLSLSTPAALVTEFGKVISDSFGLRGPRTAGDHFVEPEVIRVPMENQYDRQGR